MLLKAFQDYLSLEKNYSEHTVLAYVSDVGQFGEWLRKEVDLDIESASDLNGLHHRTIRTWMGDLLGDDSGKRTVARKVASLNAFFRFLQKSGKVESNPAARVKVPKADKKLPSFLKEDAISPLFEGLDYPDTFEGQRDKAILEVLYGCGLRRSELISLEHRHIDWANQTLKVMGKGRKERIVPFGSHALKAMKDYMKACDNQAVSYKLHFFAREDGNPLYPRLVHRIVEKHLQQVSSLQKKSPHVLRHTFATHLLDRGADLNAIKELLGHKSLSATQVYVHNSISKLKDVYHKAHPKA
jgi:integrase/recombinase XerC